MTFGERALGAEAPVLNATFTKSQLLLLEPARPGQGQQLGDRGVKPPDLLLIGDLSPEGSPHPKRGFSLFSPGWERNGTAEGELSPVSPRNLPRRGSSRGDREHRERYNSS